MKERKPLFPEYIWMFFVGLLLAIIVCMRLIPGHADYIVADNPYNDNIIFITLEGKKIHFTSFMGNEIYSTINSNNSDWTEALESDIVSYANYAKLYFGEGNFSVVVVDNYSVSYNYNRFIQLIGPIVGTVYSSYYTGSSEDFLVLNNPWTSLSENTFSEYYPTLYTLNLGGYLMPYYKLDPEALPTPTLSPSPSPELQEYNILCPGTLPASLSPSFMFSFKASGLNDIYIQPVDETLTSIFNEYDFYSQDLKYNAFVSRTGKYGGSWFSSYYGASFIFYVQVDSYSDLSFYSYNGVVTSFDTMKEVGTLSALSDSSDSERCFYQVQELEDGYCLAFVFKLGEYSSYSASDIVSDIWFQTYSYSNTDAYESIYPFRQNSTEYKQSLILRLDVEGNAVPDPNVTPTPSPTVTPTQAPYVEVILPTGSPTPTPPVTFAGSDLPGGASGEGGSISGAGGLNASEAESIYQYWTNKITNNQALAFLVSFFGFLPFDLVFALGTIIFILILLAMVRLFIHFIS